MLDIIIPDLPFESGDEVVVLLSGLGATPVMEQYIVYNRVEEILTEKGIKVHRSYVGNYFTSLEMMGVTLTVKRLRLTVIPESWSRKSKRRMRNLRKCLEMRQKGYVLPRMAVNIISAINQRSAPALPRIICRK